MPNSHPVQHHQQKVQILTRDETGLRFESLVLFADPLFELYGIDSSEAFALKHEPDEADEATVAVLEAARLLWAYFSIPDSVRHEQHDQLADYLLGPDHNPQDEADFDEIIERMQQQWEMLMPEDRAVAEGVEHQTLGLEALLAHPAFAMPSPKEEGGSYGPDGLGVLEAQALFAQPLLDQTTDPDEMEVALERASAYWEIAHTEGAARETALHAAVKSFGNSAEERGRVEQEARDMLTRFAELFPEQQP